jgi:hypothetical protein
MSQVQVNATVLLCRLLESAGQEISGSILSDSEQQVALTQLRREQLLGFGPALNWLRCPDCEVEMARVVRDLPGDKVLLLCGGDCEDVEAPRSVRQTVLVQRDRVVGHLAQGLGLNRQQIIPLMPGRLWRLGMSDTQRGKPVTWYFASHLHHDFVAHQLREHLRESCSDRSARILTSSPVPLPASSPLAQHEVIHLADVARLMQSRFEFLTDRLSQSSPAGQISPSVPERATTLKHVRTQRKAYIDGVAYPLEAMQANILLALMDDFDHRMESSALRQACGSDADRFAPVKFFGRNLLVYKTFIQYDKGDKEYVLVVPDDDCEWVD